MGKPMDEYTDDDWEAEKVEARKRAETEAATRPTPTFMERLAELARELEPDMDGVCTADQMLSGIDKPRELTFEEFCVFTTECLNDLKLHIQSDEVKGRHPFTSMGILRANRFIAWANDLEPERAILAVKTAIGLYHLPFEPAKMPLFDKYADKFKRYIMQDRLVNQTIAEIVGEQ